MLYELQAGERPFKGEQDELVGQILRAKPVSLRTLRPDVDEVLEGIVNKCLAEKPRKRYKSAGAVADDLGRWLRGRQRVRVLWMAAVAIFLIAVVVVVATSRGLRPPTTQRARPDPIRLIGEFGPPPQTPHWVYGGKLGTVKTTSANQTFTFNTPDIAALELLEGIPWDSYEFEVEMRQDGGESILGGIYVGRIDQPSGDGRSQYFLTCFFADRGVLAGTLQSTVVRCDDFPPKLMLQQSSFQTLPNRFRSASKSEDPPWRKLVFKVRPDRIDCSIGDDPIASVSDEEIRGGVSYIPGAAELPVPNLELLRHGGLGLYLIRGEASFRNAVVTQLD
jgi:serine/threonine protein kinase